MGVEIERKFLVTGSEWRAAESTYLCQGYLSRDRSRTVRVRIAGDTATLTIKGPTQGVSRSEFEYTIPVEDARSLLLLCDGPLIEKRRYVIPMGTIKWEVDEFLGDNAGLVIAEVELETEDQDFGRPAWLGAEVTHDGRYFNFYLSQHPFNTW